MRITSLIAIAALLLLVTACDDSADDTTTTVTNGATSGDAVTIDEFAFMPSSLTVSTGTTVTWTNEQDVPHTVTADDGEFDSGNLASGDDYSQTFDTAGTFAYHCTIHPSMTATITVEG
jgi:plastocyanin